jgi:hypothetical protein
MWSLWWGGGQASAVAYANRAMAFLKQAKYEAAEADCTAALALEPQYVKALSRRGTARRYTTHTIPSPCLPVSLSLSGAGEVPYSDANVARS